MIFFHINLSIYPDKKTQILAPGKSQGIAFPLTRPNSLFSPITIFFLHLFFNFNKTRKFEIIWQNKKDPYFLIMSRVTVSFNH